MAARQAHRHGSTVGELADIYFKEASQGRILHRGRSKAQSTLAIDRGRIARYVKPLLGNLPLANLTRQDVENFLFDVRDGKTAGDIRTGERGLARVCGGLGTVGKCVDLLSTMCRFAARKGWI